MKPTYEELEIKLCRTEAMLMETEAKLAETLHLLKLAIDRIALLEERLNKNSKNSSKPPSTDQKGNTDDKPKKDRKNRGGKARPSFPQERIDKLIICTQENCPYCGSHSIQATNHPPEIIQQAELPEVRAIVTEYQLLKYGCNGCGKNSIASLPTGVPDSAFGPKLMGLLATLTGVFHLAKREATQLIKDLYEIDVSVGSVTNIEERVANALDSIYDRIHKFVITSKYCKHFDETGWRDSGKRHFVWLASCEHAAFYMIDRTRSAEAFKRIIGNSEVNFASVTDRYAVYNKMGDKHQYCLAHLIRDFKGHAEREGPDKQLGTAIGKEFAAVCRIHKEYREGNISLQIRNRRVGHRKKKLESMLEDGMANGSDQLFKLCENLLNNFSKLWIFLDVPGMEPTNNLAERDLRKLVIWRKKSYGTRSSRGKRFVERITTVVQTVKRQGKNILRFIQEAIMCFYHKSESPFITESLGF